MQCALPLVPLWGIAALINMVLPHGLYALFYLILVSLGDYLWLLLLISLGLFIVAWKLISIRPACEYVLSDDREMPFYGFGDGDITASIFLGIFLGWQDFIAVFFLGFMLQIIIGLRVIYK